MVTLILLMGLLFFKLAHNEELNVVPLPAYEDIKKGRMIQFTSRLFIYINIANPSHQIATISFQDIIPQLNTDNG